MHQITDGDPIERKGPNCWILDEVDGYYRLEEVLR